MAKTRKKITLSEVWAFLSEHLQTLSKNITAIIVVVGAIVGVCHWLVAKGTEILDKRIDEVKIMVEQSEKKSEALITQQKLSLTRLELYTLIIHDPENKAEIEKLAKKYFLDLGGDQYMSSIYSQWAKEHNATTYFVTH